MMAPPQEQDYIGLAEISSPHESSSDKLVGGNGINFRETELRLGLPGSESPERKEKVGLNLCRQPPKNFAFGAKRGFSDAIDGNGKWAFSGSGGSDVEMEKGGALFSPRRGGGGGAGWLSDGGVNAVTGKTTPAPEKKTQGPPAAKAQVVGWPPIRSYRKNSMAINPSKNKEDADGGCLYVKVSMDGAPYLRKVDLKTYCKYKELSSALEKMFSGFNVVCHFSGQCASKENKDATNEGRVADLLNGSEYVLTYEDRDGDWMLVGDVPWEMFIDSCRRLRIMKGSDAIGLGMPHALKQ
ncbi:Auxin-responsive protein IAA27 [Platanthera zijinensis]|uniref:Auxin-responsive protein n=1 Tax=Platanthera zijinensis TaxID=2320716 RepID=A0AAP0BH32_9ASPA